MTVELLGASAHLNVRSYEMNLPARQETVKGRKSLEKTVLALQTARKAAKLFMRSSPVQADSGLQEVAATLRKRVKKALRAAETANAAWLDRVEQRE